MVSFTLSLIALVFGYLLYGRFVERVFAPDDRVTPAVAINKAPNIVSMICDNWLEQSDALCLHALGHHRLSRTSEKTIYHHPDPCIIYDGSMRDLPLLGTIVQARRYYHRRHCRYCPVGIAGVVLYLV